MKRIFTLLFLFYSIFIFCQSELKSFDERYFPGDQITNLQGEYLVLLPKNDTEKEFGYSNFYTDTNFLHIYKKSSSYNSSAYDNLVGQKFLLKEIKTSDDIAKTNYILYLIDKDNSQVYFKYDSKNPTLFPFKTEKIMQESSTKKEDYCLKVDVIKDKFTNKVTKRSPVNEPVSFVKSGPYYYLSLNTVGSTAVIDGTGVIILLENGKKIVKNTEISVDVDAYSGKYQYSAFMTLNKADIDLLTKFAIDDFKLYIFENTKRLNGNAYKEYLKCIIK